MFQIKSNELLKVLGSLFTSSLPFEMLLSCSFKVLCKLLRFDHFSKFCKKYLHLSNFVKSLNLGNSFSIHLKLVKLMPIE